MDGHVGRLLGNDSYEWLTYRTILYEHLNEVVVFQDDVEIGRWFIVKCLQGREVEERHFSQEQIREYRQKTWDLWKARELKVFDSTYEAQTQENVLLAQCLKVRFSRRCRAMADVTSEYEDTIQHAIERCIGEE